VATKELEKFEGEFGDESARPLCSTIIRMTREKPLPDCAS